MSDYDKCVAGCKHFTGGEAHHHKDCPHYPESMSRVYDEMEAKIKELDKPKRRPLADGTLELVGKDLEGFNLITRDYFARFAGLTFQNKIKIYQDKVCMVFVDMFTKNEHLIYVSEIKATAYLLDRFELTEVSNVEK